MILTPQALMQELAEQLNSKFKPGVGSAAVAREESLANMLEQQCAATRPQV
jgi:hypothetical protein